ncbi:MAG: SWIM zinc finger family protein [Kofleriaceae bacterium]|nr:SWIM zinc finger family protein [Kofleriaceae bacterium]
MTKRRAQFRVPRFGVGYFQAAPKIAAPSDGITTAATIGSTWWAKQWISALENLLGGDAGRLARGRTYARAGRVSRVVVVGGEVTARVTGSRIYQVTITVRALTDATWAAAVAAMASQASFAAALLNGTMPQHIDDVFRTTGATLFPTTRAELATTCTCPDWGDPCKHVAAVHYLLGDTLDRDPYLLFELRGRTKAQLLAALRLARGASVEASAATPASSPAVKSAGKPARKSAGKTKRPKSTHPTTSAQAVQAYDQMRTPLPALHFSYTAPTSAAAALQQLGVPLGWTDARSPAELLGPVVAATAVFAQRVATADPETAAVLTETPELATKPKKLSRRKR